MKRVLFHSVFPLLLAGELFADATPPVPAVEAPVAAPAAPATSTLVSDDRQRAAENLNYINAVLQDLMKRRDDPAIKDNVLLYRCLSAYVSKVRGIGARCGAILRGEKTADKADTVFAQSRQEARDLSEEAKECLGNPEKSTLAIVPVPVQSIASSAIDSPAPTPLLPERAPAASPIY